MIICILYSFLSISNRIIYIFNINEFMYSINTFYNLLHFIDNFNERDVRLNNIVHVQINRSPMTIAPRTMNPNQLPNDFSL